MILYLIYDCRKGPQIKLIFTKICLSNKNVCKICLISLKIAKDTQENIRVQKPAPALWITQIIVTPYPPGVSVWLGGRETTALTTWTSVRNTFSNVTQACTKYVSTHPAQLVVNVYTVAWIWQTANVRVAIYFDWMDISIFTRVCKSVSQIIDDLYFLFCRP